MTKYYFISYTARNKQYETVYGHCIYTAINEGLSEICEGIALKSAVTDIIITCMKDLTEDEYQMLKGGEE